jgi:hypothetical protein
VAAYVHKCGLKLNLVHGNMERVKIPNLVKIKDQLQTIQTAENDGQT